jgi:cytochrome c-type biogenesis protein CcmH
MAVVAAMFCMPAQAAIDVYDFEDPTQQERFKTLSNELRCLVCQNQPIADSNAELAQDLRRELYEMIRKGDSDETIVEFMVQRYGDFVLYRPPVNSATAFLWIGPFVMGFLALTVLAWFIRQRTKQKVEGDGTLSADERSRLDGLVQTAQATNDEPDSK